MTKPKIYLQTDDGDQVATYECIAISAMMPPPDILIWGERCFKFLSVSQSCDLIYKEAVACALVDNPPHSVWLDLP